MERRVSFFRLLTLLPGGSVLLGCSSLSSSLVPGGPRHTPQDAVNAFAGVDAGSSVLRRNPADAADVHVVALVFDVVRVDLPIEGVRHTPKIWNHVDELRVAPEVVARLARNGLRVGAASPDAWPAIRAIIDAAHAEVRRDRLVAQPGLPLWIKLASIGEPESIFSYGIDGRLVGRTFPAGEKLLTLDYAFHPELGGCSDLKLGFEIRHDRGMMTWERRDGVIRQVPAVDRHLFAEVSAVVTLNTNEFLVIGLSDQATNKYLVGGRFLILERSGKRCETLLCVTPRPYRAAVATRRPL